MHKSYCIQRSTNTLACQNISADMMRLPMISYLQHLADIYWQYLHTKVLPGAQMECSETQDAKFSLTVRSQAQPFNCIKQYATVQGNHTPTQTPQQSETRPSVCIKKCAYITANSDLGWCRNQWFKALHRSAGTVSVSNVSCINRFTHHRVLRNSFL